MSIPTAETFLESLAPGDVMCDRRREECFEVRGLDDDGIALRHADQEFYVPHSLLAAWYGSRLFLLENTASLDRPDWLSQ
jgi:hypothetical protein